MFTAPGQVGRGIGVPHRRLGAGLPAIEIPQSASLVAHWSASDITGLTNGQDVNSWVDRISGIEAADVTSPPTYATNVFGTHPAVRFANATDRLHIAIPGAIRAAIDSQVFTCMVVFRQTGTSGGGYAPLISAHAAGANAFMLVADYCDDGYDRFQRFGMQNAGFGAPIARNTFYSAGITSRTSAPELERLVVNGGIVSSSTIASHGSDAAEFYIGNDATLGRGFVGEIAEISIWSITLTPAECVQFHQWACQQYERDLPYAGEAAFRVIDGDSISAGTGYGSVLESYSYKLATSLGIGYGAWSNVAIQGITMSDMTAKAEEEVDALATQTGLTVHDYAFEWYNQRAEPTGPEVASRAYIAARLAAGHEVIFGTSTDNSTANPDPNRDSYNAAFDADHAGFNYVAIHLNANIGVEGAVAAHPTYFSDAVHLSALGGTELAALMYAGRPA